MKKIIALIFTALTLSTSTTYAGDLRECPQFNKYGPPVTMNPGQNEGSRFLCRKGYALQHSAVTKGALWVAEYLKADAVYGSEPRTNDFQPDPDLPASERSTLKDYEGSGFDRGHYAPAADFSKDPIQMSESFYLSNMGPQEPTHNRGIWANLEKYVRSMSTKRKNGLYVITGPIHHIVNGQYKASTVASACPSPSVAPGCKETFTKTDTIGRKRVYVPVAYYKVVLDPETGGTLAFVIPNMPMDKHVSIKTWIRSVRDVERLTQLDFFSALDQKTRDRIETKESGLWTR